MGKTRRQMILTGRRPSLKMRAGGPARAGAAINVYKNIVPTFLHMLNTVKLYHWKTTNYATHKATDELYGKLNEKIDQFVEVMLGKSEVAGGKNRVRLLDVPIIKLTMASNNDAFRKQIENYKMFLLNFSENKGFNTLMNTDLLAIRDEILADFNQFLYLLTLGD